ncbi:MAG: 6,7-dimethyl-8-ribityllumazine synthase, partial [Planctomyces sp.]
MPSELSAGLVAAGCRFAIVVSRFNDLVTRRLLEGAIDTVVRHGGSAELITVAWVPGSFEIPLAAERLAESGRFDAVVCLGAVIQG